MHKPSSCDQTRGQKALVKRQTPRGHFEKYQEKDTALIEIKKFSSTFISRLKSSIPSINFFIPVVLIQREPHQNLHDGFKKFQVAQIVIFCHFVSGLFRDTGMNILSLK